MSLVWFGAGFLAGRLLYRRGKGPPLEQLGYILMSILVFFAGATLGASPDLMAQLPLFGWQGFVLGLSGAVAAGLLTQLWFGRRKL